VNKCDINPQITGEIKRYCLERGLTVVGEIPYDRTIVKALLQQTPLIEYSHGPLARTITQMWHHIEQELLELSKQE
jgi:MinD superfamily P-loop ATPase